MFRHDFKSQEVIVSVRNRLFYNGTSISAAADTTWGGVDDSGTSDLQFEQLNVKDDNKMHIISRVFRFGRPCLR